MLKYLWMAWFYLISVSECSDTVLNQPNISKSKSISHLSFISYAVVSMDGLALSEGSDGLTFFYY